MLKYAILPLSLLLRRNQLVLRRCRNDELLFLTSNTQTQRKRIDGIMSTYINGLNQPLVPKFPVCDFKASFTEGQTAIERATAAKKGLFMPATNISQGKRVPADFSPFSACSERSSFFSAISRRLLRLSHIQ